MTTAVAPTPTPVPPVPPTSDDPRFYRLSVDQYEQMVEDGVLTDDDKVELIEGFLVKKMGKNGPHYTTTSRIEHLLLRILPEGWCPAAEWPILLARSVPEPDVMVLRGAIDDYEGRKPTPADVAMLVEVADSSLADDRSRSALFAEAGIPIYWIINIPERKVEVYSETTPAGYRSRRDYGSDAMIPLVIQGRAIAELAARDLLPRASS